MTDWDRHYREGHTPWDKGEASPGLLDYLQEFRFQGSVLVPGSGYGHDVRSIAAREPEIEVVGLDVSATAVQAAEALPVVGGERHEIGDLFALPAHLTGRFDWIWEHTCYCAIDPGQRDDYVEAVSAALKPEGGFVGVFYLDPYDDEHPEGGPPFGASQEEIKAGFLHRFDLLEAWVPKRAYPGREDREWMTVMRKKS